LVKVKAKGQKFRIGSSKQEQEAVAAKFFDGKPPCKLAMEDEQTVTLTDDFYLGQYAGDARTVPAFCRGDWLPDDPGTNRCWPRVECERAEVCRSG
jgi:hypothetical protein